MKYPESALRDGSTRVSPWLCLSECAIAAVKSGWPSRHEAGCDLTSESPKRSLARAWYEYGATARGAGAQRSTRAGRTFVFCHPHPHTS